MQDNKAKAIKNSQEAITFREAINLWVIESLKPKGMQTSCYMIVQQINQKHHTTVHKKNSLLCFD